MQAIFHARASYVYLYFSCQTNLVYHTIHSHAGRNTGPALWLQQFLAMFLKRVYNSLRYYIAVVTQLVLPLIFIILALFIVKIPSNTPRDDPRRVLTLRHSSISDTAEVFLAEFTDVPQAFSFEVSHSYNNIYTFNICISYSGIFI